MDEGGHTPSHRLADKSKELLQHQVIDRFSPIKKIHKTKFGLHVHETMHLAGNWKQTCYCYTSGIELTILVCIKKGLLVSLTGPCGGKTTGQARLCTFFENLGWKVRS